MRAISFLVFIVLQIFFLPLALVGAVLVGYKQMVVSTTAARTARLW